MSKVAAIIGGGVIGGGWVARFLLNGWDVQVFDPDPEAERKIGEVLANARRSLPGLTDVALPAEGQLSFHATIAEAVAGAAWIQESVPERLEIKHTTFAEVQAACAQDAVIGSSTSGFKPSELQQGAARPGQIMVAHPFNPVYLLPLIELVPGEAGDAALVEQAKAVLASLGMHPLHLKKEIDAHVADRFLEAVWREALWLIKDGIATTEEIDDAIRYGFGIRWAQMGLFETYRVAGGEAGMKHFIAQFGPCLSWPWTKLMDVPELTDELVDRIADQSDAQSGMHSIRELERIRDNNLVTMMRGLKAQNWGAGALINAQEQAMKAGTVMAARADDLPADAPVLTARRTVPLDWTDYNGHMTESRYLHAFADATDRFMEMIGCDAEYIQSGGSYFTAETHIRHLDEVHAGAVIEITTQVILGEGKKMHLFHEMREGERLLASGEHFLLHVSLETRKPSPPSAEIEAALVRIAKGHAGLPRPEGLGRAIGGAR
ncbi:carnitine 3-dehydrogenase [Sulfitobacter sp. M57]|uniref:carnitine 3-dehydrogenase n=1 Tax=unclassified Sulfitobacter TaxID=196795 RepID=UPI0023E340A1|nr:MULTISPECIES: carnitine 3-dehydrogenase [unclassified Sulfitobacter]MDF3413125.1 carnitine 3-dehydrogenase [Sulfitobacter sp. KE5]MDF3421592.1 carnitine 3-dehydrogenase [Sulfitobacter sp. KE43]MDF3431674.1 carnitine 3-dehydrogenase [Sulfitobacter sp. KE42]MDF3457315.1 carnitine 3-dehydrogenase [Sulfitobacter sp. S74]MDF3461217.1 carnitine 3-dehydrogenase [Sulfitobacter sp. Ks18]